MNNRIIKFRIWDKRNNKFWFSGTIPDFINFICPFYSRMSGLEEMIFDWGEFTFQQFTGLSDKNNKEIYEGDILKHYPGFGCVWKERKSYVDYKECAFWECHRDENNTGADFVLSDHDQSLEIIGNIFENPELLKNK